MAAMRFSTLTWLGALIVGLLAAGAVVAAERQTVEIASRTGVHKFSVELAVTDEDRGRGLMYRRTLPQGQGMMFDFKSEQDVAMWMRNT